MSREFYHYYEQELSAIRVLANEFARKYPKAAGRLELEPNRSNDPHVERLLQGFAFLAGRIHRRIDDDFPELTNGLLNILYPHYLAPIPSTMIVELTGDSNRGSLQNGFKIDRHSPIFTNPITDTINSERPGYQNLACEFRTVYPVTVWPIKVVECRFQPAPWTNLRLPSNLRIPEHTLAICQIQLLCESGTFDQLSLRELRFHLSGGDFVPDLYEYLLTQAISVAYLPVDQPEVSPIVFHPNEVIQPVGFEEDEALLPYPPHSFPGYRLLTEFFSYPAKFYFLDFLHLDRVCKPKVVGEGNAKKGAAKRIDLVIFLKRTRPNLEKGVRQETLRLGCTPAVNLFEQLIEPVDLTQDRYEYRLVPDRSQPLGMEIYSVNEVQGISSDEKPVTYRPFYAMYHETSNTKHEAFWYCTRRESNVQDDAGSDVWITLVDRNWVPLRPASQKLEIRATCTNRQMSSVLERIASGLQLNLGIAAPILNDPKVVRTVSTPMRPNFQTRSGYWKLISHLTLNHLSFTEEIPKTKEGLPLPGATNSGLAALQEILRLYNFANSETGHPQASTNEQLILGLTNLKTRRIVGRIPTPDGSTFARGMEVEIELDEEKFVGTGAFLFACILERFFGLYATINSFTQLVAKTPRSQGDRLIKRWPPRAGDLQLI